MKVNTVARIRGEQHQWTGYIEADDEEGVKELVFNDTWIEFVVVVPVSGDETPVSLRCADITFVCFPDG